MRIPRIYINDELNVGETIQLDQHAFQHVVKVLRLREGNDVILFNDSGFDFPATLVEVSKKQATAEVTRRDQVFSESPLSIHLALGISKGERMDIAIQKAVELGASSITPVYTERCVVNLDKKREAKRMEHWQGVITSACEQSGRAKLPELNQPVSIKQGFEGLPVTRQNLILSPYADSNFQTLSKEHDSVLVLIGPEGGLTENEVQRAIENDFQSVRMGPRILRTETAAITAIAMLQMLWGDLAI